MAEHFDIGGGFSEQVGDAYRNNAGKVHAVFGAIGMAGQAAWNSVRGVSESLPAAAEIPIETSVPAAAAAACSNSVLPSVASTISSTLTGGIVGGLATGAKLLSDSKTRSQMQSGIEDLGKKSMTMLRTLKGNSKGIMMTTCRKQEIHWRTQSI